MIKCVFFQLYFFWITSLFVNKESLGTTNKDNGGLGDYTLVIADS